MTQHINPPDAHFGGIYQTFANFDEIRRNQITHPIYINDIDTSTLEGKKIIDDNLITKYDSDTISITPSCNCGKISGADKIGKKCGECDSEVLNSVERPIESKLWFRRPEGVEKFINPMFWLILKRTFLISKKFNMVMYVCNPEYRGNFEKVKEFNILKSVMKEYGIPRSYNYFIQNFDSMIQLLTDKNIFKHPGQRQNKMALVKQIIEQYRDSIFADALPIPSKIAFVAERTSTAVFADHNMDHAIDAVKTASSLNPNLMKITIPKSEFRVVTFIEQMSQYYEMQFKITLAQKEGWFRKHIYGTRTHFNFRCVISSLSHNHDYDEIYIPWGIGITLMKLDIMNKLYKQGFSPIQAESYINSHVLTYSSLLDEIMKELIAESPYKGIPITGGRNPALERGSVQLFYATKVKTNVSDNTVNLSVLCLVVSNADLIIKVLHVEIQVVVSLLKRRNKIF